MLIRCVDRMLVSHSPLVESTACEETKPPSYEGPAIEGGMVSIRGRVD